MINVDLFIEIKTIGQVFQEKNILQSNLSIITVIFKVSLNNDV